ncbi:hypothetical protein X734_03185 [Mesorhizobium sp. L2C084A000]|nr:hypothetical protein X734_03185 [Mesorhizobium sp. L2C084A000]
MRCRSSAKLGMDCPHGLTTNLVMRLDTGRFDTIQ